MSTDGHLRIQSVELNRWRVPYGDCKAAKGLGARTLGGTGGRFPGGDVAWVLTFGGTKVQWAVLMRAWRQRQTHWPEGPGGGVSIEVDLTNGGCTGHLYDVSKVTGEGAKCGSG